MKYKFNPKKYMLCKEYQPWEARISLGNDTQLLKFIKALISCRGKLKNSYLCAPDLYWSQTSIITLVEIPIEAKEDFETISGNRLIGVGNLQLNLGVPQDAQ